MTARCLGGGCSIGDCGDRLVFAAAVGGGGVIVGVAFNAVGVCFSYYLVMLVLLLLCIVAILSLIHISEPTRPERISYAVFCLKKKN